MASYLGSCRRCGVQVRRMDRPWVGTDIAACGPCLPFIEASIETAEALHKESVANGIAAEKKGLAARAADKAKRAAVAQKAADDAAKAAAKPKSKKAAEKPKTKKGFLRKR